MLAVIGLRDPAEGDWGRLRGLQYSSLARLTFARLLGHALAALLVLKTYSAQIHPVFLVGWMALLVGVLISGARFDRTLVDADRRRISRQEMHRQTLSSLFVALVWAVPMLLFGPFGTEAERMMLWTVLAMLMTGMAVSFAAMPMATVLFSVVVGTSALGVFLFEGEFTAAAVASAFVAIVSVGAVEAARTFLGARVAEAGMAEKSEVVSLLLREFEEGDADWLWQVDANRRVRSVSPRFAFALGEDPEDADGKPLIQLIAGPSWDSGHFHSSLHDLAERLKRRESFSNLLVRVTLHGNHRWWELSASPKVDENGTFVGFRGVGSDVTEQRESAEKIAYLARYDTLTGLPNRLMLTEAV
ncbi:MAG: PAS domain-containing protein, partial [Pseudomonadota bacterium]